jgi:hypothetical protein
VGQRQKKRQEEIAAERHSCFLESFDRLQRRDAGNTSEALGDRGAMVIAAYFCEFRASSKIVTLACR